MEAEEDPKSHSLLTEAHRDNQPSANFYPDPIYGAFGAEEGDPGFWAKRAQKAPWRRCFGPSHDETSQLHRMVGMELLREPTLQRNSNNMKRKIVNGEGFSGQIAHFLYTAEAL